VTKVASPQIYLGNGVTMAQNARDRFFALIQQDKKISKAWSASAWRCCVGLSDAPFSPGGNALQNHSTAPHLNANCSGVGVFRFGLSRIPVSLFLRPFLHTDAALSYRYLPFQARCAPSLHLSREFHA